MHHFNVVIVWARANKKFYNHKKILTINMAEIITIGIALIGWILNIGSYYYGKRTEKQQQKRELILEYYPPLVEELKV